MPSVSRNLFFQQGTFLLALCFLTFSVQYQEKRQLLSSQMREMALQIKLQKQEERVIFLLYLHFLPQIVIKHSSLILLVLFYFLCQGILNSTQVKLNRMLFTTWKHKINARKKSVQKKVFAELLRSCVIFKTISSFGVDLVIIERSQFLSQFLPSFFFFSGVIKDQDALPPALARIFLPKKAS